VIYSKKKIVMAIHGGVEVGDWCRRYQLSLKAFQKKKKVLIVSNRSVHLGLTAPQHELREADEDGIERKDGMHDAEQSRGRDKRTVTVMSVEQRTRVR
jgi:hypothetical protein